MLNWETNTYNVKGEDNKVAHNLTQRILCISDFVVWIENVSPSLLPVVLADIVGFS